MCCGRKFSECHVCCFAEVRVGDSVCVNSDEGKWWIGGVDGDVEENSSSGGLTRIAEDSRLGAEMATSSSSSTGKRRSAIAKLFLRLWLDEASHQFSRI